MAENTKPVPNPQNPQHFRPTPSSSAPANQSSRIQDSNISKMRSLLRDLRPEFIKVLKTPDFRNCEAADGIREKMNLFMAEYQEMAYVVGGSALGWNYITRPGGKAVYYGVTKKMHKAATKSRSSSGKL